MGFTVRFLLGAVLVLSCCWLGESTFRRVRQIEDGADKVEKVEVEKTVANLTTEEISKPKTDVSTEENKTLDKQNSLISKLEKSEPYKKNQEEVGRSIDIEKYVSKEFHNKNNVYTISVSPDTEKFIEPDYSYHSTTGHDQEHTKDFHYDADLTTPKSSLFDSKFKEAVESVEQKLEHIDDSHELASSESESKESLNLEKMYDETQSNDTKANLSYVNYKNILTNDTNGKNSLHKDLVVEAGTNLDFRSSYNETKLIDENDNGNNTSKEDQVKGDQEKPETSTTKSIALTTRKSIVLTKPPSSKNTSHISILSNNIETETVKAISPVQSNSLTTTTTTEKSKGEKENVEKNTKKSLIDITKRGSVKFADYASISTEPTVSKIETKKPEQLFQENQVVPVHVEAPSGMESVETTVATLTSTAKEMLTTETVPATNLPTTTDFITTEASKEETTTVEEMTTSSTEEAEVTTVKDLTAETTTEEVTTVAASTPLTSITDSESGYSTTSFSSDLTTTTDTVTMINTIIKETTPSPLKVNTSSTESEGNVTITTENAMRISKGIVFRETVPTTESVLTTTAAQTTQRTESTIEEVATTFITTETHDEKLFTTEDNVIIVENRTNLVPDMKHVPNEPVTELDNTTDGNTVSSDSYNTIPPEDNSGTIAAITISSIGALCLILLAGLLIIMKKRQKRFNYGQRCTPVSLDDYSINNVSTNNSLRRKGILRGSNRSSYRNIAFEDPVSVSHPLNFPALGKFASNFEEMKAEFEEIPQITARTNELPDGCDVKNRYANVIPLPETRVPLTYIDGYPNSDYINANYVTGPKSVKGYYIACQAPMQNTVDDFWRMVWEQQCKVILMLTHLFENGVEKCVDYLPPSEVLDCHRAFGDFLITLKKREVKDKYIISTLQLKNMVSSSWREITHFWYLGWPEKGVPSEANSLIAFLIEARSYMKSSSIDRKNVTNGNLTNGSTQNELNPVVVHCSPGTGRTGVVIACDIAIREFEQTRLVDIPRIVYKIRRDRASAVQTKEQYAFIYKVVNLYATKLTGGALDSL